MCNWTSICPKRYDVVKFSKNWKIMSRLERIDCLFLINRELFFFHFLKNRLALTLLHYLSILYEINGRNNRKIGLFLKIATINRFEKYNDFEKFFVSLSRGKSKWEQLPCEQFLQQIEILRAFLPPFSYGGKCGKFQFVVEIAHNAVVFILICL